MRIDSSFDAVRRGAANVRANWQTMVLHVGINVSLFALTMGIFLAMRPLLDRVDANDLPRFARAHPLLIAGVVIGAVALLVIFLVLQAWIVAGNAATFVAGERADASPVFEWRAWLSAARAGMWRVIGVYLTIGALALLVFGIFAGVSMLASQQGVVACCVMAVVMPIILIGMLLMTALTAKAIVLGAEELLPARESLRLAWEEMSDRLSVHAGSLLLILVSTGIASFAISLLTLATTHLGSRVDSTFIFAPLELFMNLLQQIVSAISTNWLFATMAAVTTLRPLPAPATVFIEPAADAAPEPDPEAQS
ncbi:MAG TPA: hypothetical protein VHW00_14680 [Thermoanaerobaculia bacterium]|nr:hypothetical protein [Thermoanaerobaculia bacterium]